MAVDATLLGCGGKQEDGRSRGVGDTSSKAPVATCELNDVKAGDERSLVRGFQH